MDKKEIIILPDSWPEHLKNIVMDELGMDHYFYVPTLFNQTDFKYLENCFLIFFDSISNYHLVKNLLSAGTYLVFFTSSEDGGLLNELAKNKKVFHIPAKQQNLLLQTLKLIGSKHQAEVSIFDGFEQIRMNEEKFRNFVRNISDIITLVDQQGNILYQSASMVQKMGYEENELKGKSIFEIIHPDDIPIVANNFKEAIISNSNGKITELRLRDKNGEYLNLEANGNNQLNNPLIGAFIINSRDITDKKKVENEKNLLIHELSIALKDLRQFAFLTSHSIRSPLTNILGLVQIIKNEGKDALDDSLLLQGVEDSAKKIDEILIDLTKILSIRDSSEKQVNEVFFNELINLVMGQLETNINKYQATIEFNFYNAPKIHFNKSFLESILYQLIKNSIQFRHPDRKPIIQINSFSKDNKVCLSYQDNGIGIDLKKNQEKLFGLYQKFHKQSGRGFGLYLIANQIHSLGGKISIEESSENGTKFLLQFQS